MVFVLSLDVIEPRAPAARPAGETAWTTALDADRPGWGGGEAVVGGVAGTRLMAPGFDLMNHSVDIQPGRSHRFDEGRQMLEVLATRAYRRGEQAYISYGHAGNGSLLCNGGFSPLTGFMNEDVYNKVVEEYHLPSGEVFGLPIVMDTDDASVTVGKKLLLTYQGCNMAMMTVESKWTPDKPLECVKCYGTGTIEHPGVRMVAMERGQSYIGGSLVGIDVPVRDFPCASPKEVRDMLPADVDVVAFQVHFPCRTSVHEFGLYRPIQAVPQAPFDIGELATGGDCQTFSAVCNSGYYGNIVAYDVGKHQRLV